MSVIRKLGALYRLMVVTIILAVSVTFVVFWQPDIFTLVPFFRDSSVYIKNSAGRHTIELGAFQITTPQDFRYIRQRGIDSYVGLIANRKDTIYFDYGWYSNGSSKDPRFNHRDTINGVTGIIRVNHGKITGVSFPNVKGESGLSVYCSTWDSLNAVKIIKSIKFPDIDGITAIKPTEYNPVELKGEKLFKANCRSCHWLEKKVIGPALRGVVSRTSREWFKNWVINPNKFIRENSKAAELFNEYNEIQHTSFSSMKEEEIDQLIEYVESEVVYY